MATSNVKVNVTADGTGFHKTMGGITRSVSGLGSSIKGQLAAAFSVATIGLITRNIIQFGDEIQTMANNLNISTDSAQRFSWAARNANVEVTTLSKAMYALNKAREEARGGNAEKKGLLGQLGFTDKDLESMPKENMLLKMMEKSKNRGSTESILRQLGVRATDAGKIMGAREDFLNKNIPLASKNQIAQLDALGDAYGNIITIMKVGFIPALIAASKSLVGFSYSIVTGINDLLTRIKGSQQFDAANPGKNTSMLQKAGAVANMYGAQALGQFALPLYIGNAKSMATLKQNMAGEFERSLELYYGKESTQAGKDFASDINNQIKALTQIGEEIKKVDAVLNTTLTNKATPFISDVVPSKTVKSTILKQGGELNTDNFMKIGNMLGVDMQYRMERLTIQSNQLLTRIANGVDRLNDNNTPDTSDEYSTSSGD